MEAVLGLRAVELLCSRLCHDLVGPVGAVNNGVELMEEMADQGSNLIEAGDALDLIADSAASAARRLALFRLVLGAAGAQWGLRPADARAALDGWFHGGRISLDWAAPPSMPVSTKSGLLKLALLAALVVEEGMPRGGVLRLSPTPDEGGLTVTGTGQGAAFRAEALPALAGTLDDTALEPRSVLAHLLPRMATFYGFSLSTRQAGGEIALLIEPVSG